MKQQQTDKLFMDIAVRVSEESKCVRKKVGAILVKDNSRMISMGYNGTPTGEDNCCEDTIPLTEEEAQAQGYSLEDFNNLKMVKTVTKHNVIHAEDNVYRKLLKSTENSLGATLYCTLQPCEICADLIIDSGTVRVVFLNEYRCDKGITKLRKANVEVSQFRDITEEKTDDRQFYGDIKKLLEDMVNKSSDGVMKEIFPPASIKKSQCAMCGLTDPVGCNRMACPYGNQIKY